MLKATMTEFENCQAFTVENFVCRLLTPKPIGEHGNAHPPVLINQWHICCFKGFPLIVVKKIQPISTWFRRRVLPLED